MNRDYTFGVYFPVQIQATPLSNQQWSTLTKQKRDILSQFDKTPEATLKLLLEKLPHIHERALRQELETLKKLEIIQSYGKGRAAFWKLTSNKP